MAEPEIQSAQADDQQEALSALHQELNNLKRQLEHCQSALQKEKEINRELSDKSLRLQAEFENFRQRMQKEKSDFMRYALENLFKNLLPLIDNFELALESAEKSSCFEGLSEGVKLIHSQFLDTLQKEGLTRFSSLGELFDPRKHEAVIQVDSDGHGENTVVEEFKKGYCLHDRLLRPALVAVVKG
ncbi:MAG: nucleotide exchange factor GrpE [bacterium]